MTRCSALFASCLTLAVILVPTGRALACAEGDAPALSAYVQQLTCAPRILSRHDDGAPRVLGGRDRQSPGMLAPREVIVVSAGEPTQVAAGQLFVAYRRPRSRGWAGGNEYLQDAAQNAGVVRIDSISGNTAIATIVWACDGVDVGDRLESFVTPPQPPDSDVRAFVPEVSRAVVGEGAGVVQFGEQDHRMGAERDFVLVNRVTGQDVQPGQRVGFFRRFKGADGVASLLGEGVVEVVSERGYLVRIVGSREAIEAGDLVGTPGR